MLKIYMYVTVGVLGAFINKQVQLSYLIVSSFERILLSGSHMRLIFVESMSITVQMQVSHRSFSALVML